MSGPDGDVHVGGDDALRADLVGAAQLGVRQGQIVLDQPGLEIATPLLGEAGASAGAR